MTKNKENKVNGNNRILTDQSSMNSYIKSICDIMRRDKTKGAMQYIPELTWMMFLRILDENEEKEEMQCDAVGKSFTPSLKSPYRWRDWGSPNGSKRKEIQEKGKLGDFLEFVNNELIPYMKSFEKKPNATIKQKIISQIFRKIDKTQLASERNLFDVLDRIEHLTSENIDDTHQFPLSQIYEGLLLKMGEKGNDGGQFFTPREVIRAMIRTIKPKIKIHGREATFYDCCCGTGGFLAETFVYLMNQEPTASEIDYLKHNALWGLDDSDDAFPIALANLALHGIDFPHIGIKNTLSGRPTYIELFQGAPSQFDYILTNPPFGGSEGEDAKTNFAYKTGSTQVLFLQHIIDKLKDGGTCAMVIDEGVLFRTNETSFVQTKRKLLEECDLWCIISLPQNVFVNAGAGVKTNLLFFTKGKPTKRIWFYDMSNIKVRKKLPFTIDKFDDFFKAFNSDKEKDKITDNSWYIDIDTIKSKNYDIKAVNPNIKEKVIPKPEELIKIIEESQAKINESLKKLKEIK
ncbi:MAG TPA: N-6 DNA methylase [Candidatus Paceibacterota bacterium]|nr:N-6 DNA methylase [Candidatus Paceibacterota bacterium]